MIRLKLFAITCKTKSGEQLFFSTYAHNGKFFNADLSKARLFNDKATCEVLLLRQKIKNTHLDSWKVIEVTMSAKDV